MEHQQVVSEINNAAAQYKAQLMRTYKLDDGAANTLATQYAEGIYAKYQYNQAAIQANALAKTAKAQTISQRTGAPVDMLMQYNDPQSMEAAGGVFQKQAAEIAALKKQVADGVVKVPTQKPDSNRGSPGASTNPSARRADFAAGRTPNTAAEFEKAYGYRP
mgnify:FL=1